MMSYPFYAKLNLKFKPEFGKKNQTFLLNCFTIKIINNQFLNHF